MNSPAGQAVATTRLMRAKPPTGYHVAKSVTVNLPPHVGKPRSHDAVDA